jgi:hypothetical protein
MGGRTPSDIKHLLKTHGMVVYRTVGDTVTVAERVRDNLIMEAHVSVVTGPSLCVRFATRAQRSDFPSSSETEDSLLRRARAMGTPALPQGFSEVRTVVEPIPDPMDPSRHLDTWYQVLFEKPVETDDALIQAVRDAVSVEKVAPR